MNRHTNKCHLKYNFDEGNNYTLMITISNDFKYMHHISCTMLKRKHKIMVRHNTVNKTLFTVHAISKEQCLLAVDDERSSKLHRMN